MQEEIEAHKKEWELGHLKSLKEEEEKAAAASDSDPEELMTIPREEACQVNNRSQKARTKSKNASVRGSLSDKKPVSTISTRRSKVKTDDECSISDSTPITAPIKFLKDKSQTDSMSSVLNSSNTPNSRRNSARLLRSPKVSTPAKPTSTINSLRSSTNSNQSTNQPKRPTVNPSSNTNDKIILRSRRTSAGINTRFSSQGFISPNLAATTTNTTPSKYFTRRSNER